MTAKEMFIDLNTSYFENEERITIEFFNTRIDDFDFIEFDKKCKTISISIDQQSLKFYTIDFGKLFLAINKQLKELGWGDK